MSDLKTKLHQTGTRLVNAGETLQQLATPRAVLKDMPVPVNPIPEEDALVLVDTLKFLSRFPRVGIVGTTMIVRFKSPLTLAGETYSMANLKFGVDHVHVPQGKKRVEVEILNQVIISKRGLPLMPLLSITEMDCTVQSDGRLALTPTADVSFAFPAVVQPDLIPLWS